MKNNKKDKELKEIARRLYIALDSTITAQIFKHGTNTDKWPEHMKSGLAALEYATDGTGWNWGITGKQEKYKKKGG